MRSDIEQEVLSDSLDAALSRAADCYRVGAGLMQVGATARDVTPVGQTLRHLASLQSETMVLLSELLFEYFDEQAGPVGVAPKSSG